jgi:hypothetical protein
LNVPTNQYEAFAQFTVSEPRNWQEEKKEALCDHRRTRVLKFAALWAHTIEHLIESEGEFFSDAVKRARSIALHACEMTSSEIAYFNALTVLDGCWKRGSELLEWNTNQRAVRFG